MKRIEWFYDEENYGYGLNSIVKIVINQSLRSINLYKDSWSTYRNFI